MFLEALKEYDEVLKMYPDAVAIYANRSSTYK
jgi:hypothetical protein